MTTTNANRSAALYRGMRSQLTGTYRNKRAQYPKVPATVLADAVHCAASRYEMQVLDLGVIEAWSTFADREVLAALTRWAHGLPAKALVAVAGPNVARNLVWWCGGRQRAAHLYWQGACAADGALCGAARSTPYRAGRSPCRTCLAEAQRQGQQPPGLP